MMRTRGWIAVALLTGLAVCCLRESTAADAGGNPEADPGPKQKADGPTTRPSEGAQAPSAAEKAMEQLRKRREAAPRIEPTNTSGIAPIQASVRPQVRSGAVDQAVMGVAPGARPPTLRREGEFVISRKGRVVATPDGGRTLFHFEADAESSPEAPMVLLQCRLLQNMEDIVHQRGDQAVFIITGQVFVYRGANYLLPTMFTLSIDKGNLRK